METNQVIADLETGKIRAASQNSEGTWIVHREVKEKILELLRRGQNAPMPGWPGYIDKDTLTPRAITLGDQVRMVPGGSSIRAGVYTAPQVVIMPPSFINVGAYIDQGTMVDSHVLVGSCAQIGKRVHLSTGVQIGGVLEPVGATPVIIEDDVFIGANVAIVEGMLIQRRAVIAPGVILSSAVEIYDLVNETQLSRGATIPEGAVVIPGSQPVSSLWGQQHNLQKNCALIVKYRDDKTDSATALESALR